MPSPFPGMNPYFEQASIWADFHTEILTTLRRLLVPQLRPTYFVQIEVQKYIQELSSQARRYVDKVRYLEVRDREGRDLVTVIELLSPSNKRAGDDRESYLKKRSELLRSPAHLVEIDLLRGWTPMPHEGRPECDYSVMVSLRRAQGCRSRGLLAHQAEGPTAGHPHPAPAPRRTRTSGSPGGARPRIRRTRVRALHLQWQSGTRPLP